MNVSIVIASKNRPEDIVIGLQALGQQPTAPYEIIVIDQSKTPYELPKLPNLIHVHDPGLSGLTAARNVGIDRATGDVVLFLDDDAVVLCDVVAAIQRRFANRSDVVGGQCRIVNYERSRRSVSDAFTEIFERGYFNSRPIHRVDRTLLRSVHGCAMAFRTELLRRERFDETLVGYCLGEDFEFAQRARAYGELELFDDAAVRHEPSAVNRHSRATAYRWRWKNFGLFFRRSDARKSPLAWIAFRWWQLGEILRWLRFGFGDPRKLMS